MTFAAEEGVVVVAEVVEGEEVGVDLTVAHLLLTAKIVVTAVHMAGGVDVAGGVGVVDVVVVHVEP